MNRRVEYSKRFCKMIDNFIDDVNQTDYPIDMRLYKKSCNEIVFMYEKWEDPIITGNHILKDIRKKIGYRKKNNVEVKPTKKVMVLSKEQIKKLFDEEE